MQAAADRRASGRAATRRAASRRLVVGSVLALALVGLIAALAGGTGPAGAAPTPPSITPITAPTITAPPPPAAPTIPTETTTTPTTPDTSSTGTAGAGASPGAADASGASGSTGNTGSISINLGNLTGSGDSKNPNGKPNQSIIIVLLLTVLAIAPALMVMLTSFTRIVIVLSLTRNAIGLTAIPPNQVVIGLAMFLSLFVMAPTLTQMNNVALQPLLKGDISYSQAYNRGQVPLRGFMLAQTRKSDLVLFTAASGEKPAPRDQVQMTALVPAFVLSELKTAFIIGFVIFIPFLIIDLIVSSTLMSMGMFMLPPVLVSLPFKLLLFVMVDGWALIVRSLITSFHH
jgi:flagellar biosynthesis protein FliP